MGITNTYLLRKSEGGDISDELDMVLERYGEWCVTEYGLERMNGAYPIEANRLWEHDWLSHMRMKNSCDFENFETALFAARRVHYRIKPKQRKRA